MHIVVKDFLNEENAISSRTVCFRQLFSVLFFKKS